LNFYLTHVHNNTNMNNNKNMFKNLINILIKCHHQVINLIEVNLVPVENIKCLNNSNHLVVILKVGKVLLRQSQTLSAADLHFQ